MMNRTTLVVAGLFLCGFQRLDATSDHRLPAASDHGLPAASDESYDFSPLTQRIEGWVDSGYYPGAAMILAKDDRVLYKKYFGNYTPSTVVYIASAGKWLAAATIAAVVDEGKLSWDDKVKKWLPAFTGAKGEATLRQLLSHTAGYPDYQPPGQHLDDYSSLATSVAHILPLPADTLPGVVFHYGGLAMQVAGRMAELATGKDWETLFQEKLARPLNMPSTHFTPVDTTPGHNPMLGGGARTTLDDYAHFLAMIAANGLYQGKRILSAASLREMESDQVHAARVPPDQYVEHVRHQNRSDIYGLGEWREEVDAGGRATLLSSPGWAGAYPFVDKRYGVYGFFLARVNVEKADAAHFSAFYSSPVLPVVIRKIVGEGTAAVAMPVVVPVKASPFDLGEIRLLPGPFKASMDREGRWLLSLPADRLLHSFRVNAGMSTVDKNSKTKMPRPLGGWEQLDMELRGHSIGHLLSGLAFQYASTGESAFRLKGDSIVSGLAEVQRVLNQGGYLSAFPQEYVDRNLEGGAVWAPWYTLHKLLAGLIDQYVYTGNRQALTVAIGMGNWALRKLSPLSAERLQQMLRNEFGGINEAWYNLYGITGNPEYKRLAELFYHHAALDPLARGEDDLPGLHANTVIPKINGEARAYELMGDSQARKITEFFWDDVIRSQTFAIGSNSDREHFFARGQIAHHLTGYTGETCNTYNMLKVTRHLFSWTADEKYVEYYERALYNHILGQQDPESGMVCYFTPLKAGAYKLYSTPDSSFWCCVGTGFESHSKYGEGIYYHDGRDLFVNLFIPSVLSWREGGIVLRQETSFPEEARTTLIVDSVAPAGAARTIYLRYPAWATEGVTLTVNGKIAPVHQAAGSYIRLQRQWQRGDRIVLSCPMSLRLVPAPDSPSVAAIAYGPIVLAGAMGTEQMRRPFHDPSDPYEYYDYDYGIPAGLVHTLSLHRPLDQCLRATGRPLEFETREGCSPVPIRLEPYYRIHRQRTVVYWDLAGPDAQAGGHRDPDSSGPVNEQSRTIVSPDGHLQIIFHQRELSPGKRAMYYQVNYKNKPVIEESRLDIRLDNHLCEEAMALKVDTHADWCENLIITGIDTLSKDTVWRPRYGECNFVPDHYNAVIVHLVKDDNAIYKMDIELRAYNEGVAFRYFFPENPKGAYYRVVAENTEFHLPPGAKGWFTNWAQGPYTLRPLQDWPGESERPLTLRLADGPYVCLTEGAMVDYSRTKFRLSTEKPNTIVTAMNDPADLISPVGSPWRLILIGDRPGDLIEHDYLVLNVNQPDKIGSEDWIKPGKQMRLMIQTPEEAYANIDFLVKHHLQYLLLDWKWYGPAFTFTSDATRPVSSVGLPAILEYAKAHGIGVWLYANMQALYAQSDSMFRVYHEWGVKGVKFGFVQVGSQRWTTWLESMLQKAAENKIMVDVHDDWRPTGEQRTWPNLLTAEGVRGNEEMPDATHNTILPFTRGIAGPADYTLCYYDPRIKTTHAHQLAMAAVYYSPLQTMYWYDKPSQSHDEPELEFWDRIPTTWDETRVVQGAPGEYVTIARRKGEEWFVGTLNNNEGRQLKIALDFLQQGKKYEATVYSDDSTIPTQTHVSLQHFSVDAGMTLDAPLLPSGGQAIWIRPGATFPTSPKARYPAR